MSEPQSDIQPIVIAPDLRTVLIAQSNPKIQWDISELRYYAPSGLLVVVRRSTDGKRWSVFTGGQDIVTGCNSMLEAIDTAQRWLKEQGL